MITSLLHQFYILNFTFYAIYRRKVSWALPISKRTFHADKRIEKKEKKRKRRVTHKQKFKYRTSKGVVEDVQPLRL